MEPGSVVAPGEGAGTAGRVGEPAGLWVSVWTQVGIKCLQSFAVHLQFGFFTPCSYTSIFFNLFFLIFCIYLALQRLESPLDSKGIKPVNPKGNQPWICIGRTGAEAPILWPPDEKNQLAGKDSDAGKDWGPEERGGAGIQDEMVGWHHWLNGLEFEQTPGGGPGQGNLACCSPWGCKEWDTTELLNNSNVVLISALQWSEPALFVHISPPYPTP